MNENKYKLLSNTSCEIIEILYINNQLKCLFFITSSWSQYPTTR